VPTLGTIAFYVGVLWKPAQALINNDRKRIARLKYAFIYE